jgi:hypothetical protein
MNKQPNIVKLAVIAAGLLILTVLLVLMLGNARDFKTRGLLSLYVWMSGSLVAYCVYVLYCKRQIVLSLSGILLFVTSYGIAFYCIWMHPGFYAQYWKPVNALLITTILYVPVSLLLAKYYPKK